jgi:tetratricopeptide (TPR) repeat protein
MPARQDPETGKPIDIMISWFQRMLGKHPSAAGPGSVPLSNNRLGIGMAHEKSGDLDAAEMVYREILRLEGNSIDALHLLGKLLAKSGKLDESEAMLGKAHSLHPDDVDLACDLCNVYQLKGDLPRARECYSQALEKDPSRPLPHYNLGTTLLGLGDKEAAVLEIETAVRIEPSFYKAKRHLSLLLFEQGVKDRAIPLIKSLLAENEEDATLLYCMGRYLYEEGKYNEAIRHLKYSIKLDDKNKKSFMYLGMCLEKKGAYTEAIQAAERSLEIDHHYIHGMQDLGSVYLGLGDKVRAEKYFKGSLALDVGNVNLLARIGDIYLAKKLYSDAIDYYKNALRVKPDYIPALNNLGACYQEIGNSKKAAEYFQQILLIDPENAESHFNYSLSLLLDGEFGKGWKEYEWGLKASERKTREIRKSDINRWRGENIADQSILVRAEQGLGDEIMFASCLQDLISCAGHVYIECDRRLENIYKRSFPDATIMAITRKNPPLWEKGKYSIDYQVPLGSLPVYFRNSWDDFPRHEGYLKPDPDMVARWKGHLASLGDSKKIGISWRGGTPGTRAEIRSTDLVQWLPIFKVPNTEFINLQYLYSSKELSAFQEEYPVRIHTWDEVTRDVDEAAALIASLDLVISVQTAIVHLSGSLGAPVWVLVPSRPEWRYLNHGNHMPWYPTAQLFRQLPGDPWEVVTQKIGTSLAVKLASNAH